MTQAVVLYKKYLLSLYLAANVMHQMRIAINTDPDVSSITFASLAVHEWTHHQQATNDLPVNSLWSERAAFTKQGEFMQKVLNRNRFKKADEEQLVKKLRYFATLSYNYRNGFGFENHTKGRFTKDDRVGGPMKKQNIHNEDFVFGY